MCSPGHLCSHSPGTKGAQFPRLQPPPQLLVSFLVSPQSRKQSSVLSEGAGRKAAWNPASTWGGGGGTLLGPYWDLWTWHSPPWAEGPGKQAQGGRGRWHTAQHPLC